MTTLNDSYFTVTKEIQSVSLQVRKFVIFCGGGVV